MDFWLCFTCPTRFCELLQGDLRINTIFLQDLIGQALYYFRLSGAVVVVELNFFGCRQLFGIKLKTEVLVQFTRLHHIWLETGYNPRNGLVYNVLR
jgi:hypothetical protein